MKVFGENTEARRREGRERHMLREHGPGHHIPPHERNAMMHIGFTEQDWGLLKDVFGDEDTAMAAAAIIQDAPPEIQILAVQVMNMIEKEVV